MPSSVRRLRTLFLILAIVSITVEMFVDGDSRLGMLLSVGVIVFLSSSVVCAAVVQDLNQLAFRNASRTDRDTGSS